MLQRVVTLLITSFFLLEAKAETSRAWTDAAGRTFEATPLACDGLRATLRLASGRVAIVPHSRLSPADMTFLREWRRSGERPLIAPDHLPPWPAEAPPADKTVQAIPVDDAAAGTHRYESAHFVLTSDISLPLHVVRDLAAVLEATRNAVISVPLGLMTGWRTEKYKIALYGNESSYAQAGGATATGGIYDGRTERVLLLLPNLGIHSDPRKGQRFQHGRNLFVLKHEATHQLLDPWRDALPTWLDEGFSECIAAMPYVQGRYRFANLDAAMRDYLLKWQPSNSRTKLMVVPPDHLMSMTRRQWDDSVAEQSAYHLYNSAGLLAYYFLRHDGGGKSAGLAAYFDAVRRGVDPRDAEREHLLRGRTHQALTAELHALARKLGITLEFTAGK